MLGFAHAYRARRVLKEEGIALFIWDGPPKPEVVE